MEAEVVDIQYQVGLKVEAGINLEVLEGIMVEMVAMAVYMEEVAELERVEEMEGMGVCMEEVVVEV